MMKDEHSGLIDLQLVFITDEAYFHLSHYESDLEWWKPHAVNTRFLHDIKLDVRCAVNVVQITGPVFYEKTVNSD